MKRRIAAILLLSASSLLKAEPNCGKEPRSKCWQPLAEELAKHASPQSEREREGELFAYLLLAKMAHSVGDFEDAKGYYNVAFSLADAVSRDRAGTTILINTEAAALALSMHDYELALQYLDAARSSVTEEMAETMALRATALIGLERHQEAQEILTVVLQKLPFDGHAPYCASPVGPEPRNPYDLALRIAAYYQRQGRSAQAQQLLAWLETKRQAVLAASQGKEKMAGGLWASSDNSGISPKLEDPLKDVLGR